MLENAFLMDNIMNKLDTTVSIISLIRSLAKIKFYNAGTLALKSEKTLFIKELQFKVDCLSQQTKKETS
jgi:hypothetical protein